ncbi:MAG: ATP-binding protein [Robiginitomaculum sp.]|nr:ATP-binding protein [Robiginitomaculum sp.]
MSDIQEGSINAARLFEALGKIGYSPTSAVLDILDNSISAEATKVHITIKPIEVKTTNPSATRLQIDKITIADNGQGMSTQGLHNALSIGSSSENYTSDTLSKFGMGLKSASSSLGKRLTIVSRLKNEPTMAATVDQDLLKDKYEYTLIQARTEQVQQLDEVAGTGNSGTLIIIDKIRQNSLPKVEKILEEIERKAGVIFHYYLEGLDPAQRKISIILNGEAIKPFDPLFVTEISAKESKLDERTWDGLSVKWVQEKQHFNLTQDGSITALIEITQLPHPPTVSQQDNGISQNQCREHYNIGAAHYGFYIYRNGRLISWADSLDGHISRDQDLYSFRGRIFLKSDSDEILNIDVTKSQIRLSEVANAQLAPLISEAKKKSKLAWQYAGTELSKITTLDPHSTVNVELDKVASLQNRKQKLSDEASSDTDRKKNKSRRTALEKNTTASEDEAKHLKNDRARVQYVKELDYGQLWERAHDPKDGLFVRVNKSHQLYREIISQHSDNQEMIRVLDILFYAMARGEYTTLYATDFDAIKAEKIMNEYREQVGMELSDILRQIRKL